MYRFNTEALHMVFPQRFSFYTVLSHLEFSILAVAKYTKHEGKVCLGVATAVHHLLDN